MHYVVSPSGFVSAFAEDWVGKAKAGMILAIRIL